MSNLVADLAKEPSIHVVGLETVEQRHCMALQLNRPLSGAQSVAYCARDRWRIFRFLVGCWMKAKRLLAF